MKIFKKAFTLAEVLITIGIVGIVAAITIPNIYTNVRKQVTIGQFKSAYAIFSQAIRKSYEDNGEVSGARLTGTKKAALEYPEIYLLPYLKDVKRVKGNHMVKSLSNSTMHFMLTFDYAAAYELPNGMRFAYSPGFNIIAVDVNGAKKPNVAGLDTFNFLIDTKKNTLTFPDINLSNTRLINHSYGCKYQESGNHYAGYHCSTKIFKDGFKIKEDYPWR